MQRVSELLSETMRLQKVHKQENKTQSQNWSHLCPYSSRLQLVFPSLTPQARALCNRRTAGISSLPRWLFNNTNYVIWISISSGHLSQDQAQRAQL